MPDRYRAFCELASRRSPQLAIVLGSGLGALAQNATVHAAIPFADIPGFAKPSVAGHEGIAYLGDWAGQSVLIFSGRLHRYEGVPWPQVVRSVHIAKELGAHTLLLTNSAGGIRDDLTPGSLLVVKNHLEWHRPHFWRNAADPSPYDRGLIERLQAAGQRLGLTLPAGTYAQVSGPCYETPAEIAPCVRSEPTRSACPPPAKSRRASSWAWRAPRSAASPTAPRASAWDRSTMRKF